MTTPGIFISLVKPEDIRRALNILSSGFKVNVPQIEDDLFLDLNIFELTTLDTLNQDNLIFTIQETMSHLNNNNEDKIDLLYISSCSNPHTEIQPLNEINLRVSLMKKESQLFGIKDFEEIIFNIENNNLDAGINLLNETVLLSLASIFNPYYAIDIDPSSPIIDKPFRGKIENILRTSHIIMFNNLFKQKHELDDRILRDYGFYSIDEGDDITIVKGPFGIYGEFGPFNAVITISISACEELCEIPIFDKALNIAMEAMNFKHFESVRKFINDLKIGDF